MGNIHPLSWAARCAQSSAAPMSTEGFLQGFKWQNQYQIGISDTELSVELDPVNSAQLTLGAEAAASDHRLDT